MTATLVRPPETGQEQPAVPRRISTRPSGGDLAYRAIARVAGVVVLAIMAGVGLFLAIRAVTALKVAGFGFLTTSEWNPDQGRFGIAAVLPNGVTIALVALVVSLPLALSTALFISEIAPRRLARALTTLVDLMAAVPSVVFGLWGFFLLQPHVVGFEQWLATWAGWFPLFHVPGLNPTDPLSSQSTLTANTFIAGLVVGMMVTPIQTAVMREVFSQAPAGEREGAYALGASRWGMIRAVVLSFGKGGIIGGSMLGLGRALGETIAVYLIISPIFTYNPHILSAGSNSVSALIALRFGDASPIGISALFAAGLALFLLTLIVNFTASTIVARSRSGAETG